MTAHRSGSLLIVVLLVSALFVSVSSIVLPVPVHALVTWDVPPVAAGPVGTFVSFQGHSAVAVPSGSCTLTSTYPNFFSPSVTPVCTVTGNGMAAGSITGYFKVRGPTEISSSNPLPGDTFVVSWTLTTSVGTESNGPNFFTITPSIAFSLSSSGPWTSSVPFDVMETQTLYVHGWGFNPASTGCVYTGDPPLDTELTCSIANGEMSGGFIPPLNSHAGSPYTVTITGNSGSPTDFASATVTVVTGPVILLSPTTGAAGLKVTISGTGFSSTDSATCAVSVQSTAPAGGGALYDFTPTCTMTTVGTWMQVSGYFNVSTAATIAPVTLYTVRVTGSTGDYAQATFTPSAAPTISLVPPAGPYVAGTTVTVNSGATFFSSVDVGACSLTAAPTTLFGSSSCAITAAGHLVGTLFIVSNTAGGQTYTVTVTGSRGDYASTTLTVTSSVTLNPTSGVPPVAGSPGASATEVNVTGSGFVMADTTCTITATINAAPAHTMNIDTTGEPACKVTSGVLSAKFKVGAGSTFGPYNIIVTGNAADTPATPPVFQVNPQITSSPKAGITGVPVTVAGSGFKWVAAPAICATFDSAPVGLGLAAGTCTLNTDGTVVGTFTVAALAASGNYTITVTGIAVAPVDTATAQFSKIVSISIFPPSGRPGTNVVIQGTGFNAGDIGCQIITYPNNLISNPVCLLGGGSMTGSFTVATGAAGAYSLKVVGTTGDEGRTTFYVATGATLVLNPISGEAGTTVTAKGSYYQGTICTISAGPGGALFSSYSCSIAAGNLTGSFTVASTATAGMTYTVTAQSNLGAVDSATAPFAVTAGPTTTLALTPTSGPMGTVVSGKGMGFPTDVNCNVYSAPSNIFSTIPSCTVAGGNVTVGFTVSSSATIGIYQILVLGNTGRSASASFSVTATPLFSLSAYPSSVIISPGGASTPGIVVTISPSGGFSSPVTLSAPLPADVTGGFSPNPVSLSGGTATSTLSITVATNAPTSTTAITITGTSGTSVATTAITLIIQSSVTTTTATTTGVWAPPQCVIATATFGSEAAPAVQFLRGFRDNLVLKTTAGSAFMQVFNAWYYSFSPSVAQFIANNDPIRAPMRVLLYPLLGVLGVSAFTYSLFSASPEFAIVIAGLVASSMIGLVYLTLPTFFGLRRLLKRKAIAINSIAKISSMLLIAALAFLAAGELAGSFILLAIGSSTLVLTCIVAAPVLVSLAILRTKSK